MESVLKNLQDPGWWFTAIFVALIVGVGAGYVRERLLYPMLAAVSERFNNRRANRAQAVEEMIAVLAANPEFMILTFLRLLFTLVLLVGLWVLIVLLMVVNVPHPEIGGAGPLSFLFQPVADPALGILVVLVLCIVLGYLGYVVLSRTSRVMTAYERYRRARGLPPVLV